MRHYLLILSCAILISATNTSQAQERDSAVTGLASVATSSTALSIPQGFNEKEALRVSQAAIGNKLGDYTFLDRSGRKVRIADYRGKPLVISLIYTHCPTVCATTTRSLSTIKASQEALGEDSFGVLTVGFDTQNDTPEAMDSFAKRMQIDLPKWNFVSSDPETIRNLARDLGFVYVQNEYGGFDHTAQTTFIDGRGEVYRQVYGDDFDNRTLLEPLKDMIYNIKTARHGFEGFSSKVKLFCTVYDSRAGKYEINYSFFYGVGWSVFISILIFLWIRHEYRRSPKREYPRQEIDTTKE